MGRIDVVGPHRRGQPVDAVVGHRQCLVLRAEGGHGEHRAEDLLTRDTHVRAYCIEDGRLDVIAARLGERTFAAERQARPVCDATVDVAEDASHVTFIDQRTHLGSRIEGVPERDAGGDAPNGLEQRFTHALVYDETRARVAGLAGVVVDPPGNRLGRDVEVGVREHDVRTLTATLERDALQIGVAGVAQHEFSDLGRAGEADHVDVCVEREWLAGLLAETRDDVQHARGNACLERELTEANGAERRLLGGFEHHGVADEKCRPELPTRHDQRIVPRHDRSDHPERLTTDQREVVRTGWGDLVVELVGVLAVIGDALDGFRNVDLERVLDRLTDIERFEHRQPLEVGANQLREAQQHTLALARLGATPVTGLERSSRGSHRRIDVRAPAAGDLGDDASVDRALFLENLAAARCHQLAIDERPSLGPKGRDQTLPVAAAAWAGYGVHEGALRALLNWGRRRYHKSPSSGNDAWSACPDAKLRRIQRSGGVLTWAMTASALRHREQ